MRLVKAFIFSMLVVVLLPVGALCQPVVTGLDITFGSTSEGSFTLRHRAGVSVEMLDLSDRGGQEVFSLEGFTVDVSSSMQSVKLVCSITDIDTGNLVSTTSYSATPSSGGLHWSSTASSNLLSGLEGGVFYTLSYHVEATDSHSRSYTLDNAGTDYEVLFVVAGAHYVPTGDVNNDGHINIGDVSEVYKVILGVDMTHAAAADVNDDGVVNTGDISSLYLIILGE